MTNMAPLAVSLGRKIHTTRGTSVYEGARLDTGERVIVKFYHLEADLGDSASTVLAGEAFVMRALGPLLAPEVLCTSGFNQKNGRPRLVMEWIDGISLQQLIDHLVNNQETLPNDVLAELMFRIAHVLHQAHNLRDPETKHRVSFVARDIKPSNIMLGADGRVRLIDFDISFMEGVPRGKRHEARCGSHGFIPISQFEKFEGKKISPADDVHALGMTFYNLASLKTPLKDVVTDFPSVLVLSSPVKLGYMADEFPRDLPGAARMFLEMVSYPQEITTAADAMAIIEKWPRTQETAFLQQVRRLCNEVNPVKRTLAIAQ